MGTSQPHSNMPKQTTGAARANVPFRMAATTGPGIAFRIRAAFAKRLCGVVAVGPTDQSGPPAAGRRGVSLAGSLVVLVAVVALPLMVLAASALWLQYLNQRNSAEAQLVEQARSIALLVDREFERTRAVAETLAAAVAVASGDLSGDLNAVEGELRAARDLLATNLAPESHRPILGLMHAQGFRLLNTEWAPGERRTGLHGTPVALSAVAEGRPVISDLFIGASASAPVVALAVPVFALTQNAGGGRDIIGAIGISIPRERLIAIVNEAGVPPGGSVSVLDRKGVVVARSLRDAETVGKTPASVGLKTILASEYGIAPPDTMTPDKVSSVVAFARAPYTGYILGIDVPDQVFLAPLRNSLLRSAAVGILVLMGGLALAIVTAGRIVSAFGRALGTATRTGATGTTAIKSSGLSEADDLAALLRTTFAEREQASRDVRALIDDSPIGIVIFDADGLVHEVNDALLSIVGLTRADLPDGAFIRGEMTQHAWVAAAEAAFAEALRTGQRTPYEKLHRRPDGVVVPVLVSYGPGAAFVMDLTGQRAAEAAYTETEERLSFSLSAGRLGAWEVDLNTRVLRCSDITKTLLGRGLEEALSYDEVLSQIHPDDQERVRSAVGCSIRDGGDFRIEHRFIWPDGSIHWIEGRGRALLQPGKAARLVCISADITERKQAEAALRDSEVRLRAITDTMPQIVWSTRPDGYHDYYNQRWYELTGATPERTEGDRANPLFHLDDRTHARARWRHSLATGEPFEIEYRLRMANGSYRWMLSRALPIRAENTGEILRWFGTCTDIEETVAARETLARSREDLEQLVAARTQDLQASQATLAQAQRMEALGQLAGGIAHDFNNVLQAVLAGGELLELRPADTDGVRRYARMILEAADRGSAVTQRLLAFARRGDLRAESVDPAALHTSMRDILAHTLGDGVKVGISLAPDLPPLLADKGQLETVLINLAANGRDAMSGIGVLTLAATSEIVGPDDVPGHRGHLKAGGYVALSVSDTGAGMDALTLARATEPFFTTKPIGKGTGLGLAMARGFAEQSGGGFHIASTLGRGTTVTLWFPVAEGGLPVGVVPTENIARIAARQNGVRLLLVDDDTTVRDVTAEVMEASGFVVLRAESAAAALAILDRNEDVDILISDLSMPDVDGVSLIREAQRRRPGLPAILLTGFATNAAEIARDGAISSNFLLLRKPIHGLQLAERVAGLLDAAPERD